MCHGAIIAMMSQKASGMFCIAAAVISLAGCGGTKTEEPKKVAEKKPVEYFHVDPSMAASVHGRIVFQGTKPLQKPISMEADAACEKAHQGKKVYEESVVT